MSNALSKKGNIVQLNEEFNNELQSTRHLKHYQSWDWSRLIYRSSEGCSTLVTKRKSLVRQFKIVCSQALSTIKNVRDAFIFQSLSFVFNHVWLGTCTGRLWVEQTWKVGKAYETLYRTTTCGKQDTSWSTTAEYEDTCPERSKNVPRTAREVFDMLFSEIFAKQNIKAFHRD